MRIRRSEAFEPGTFDPGTSSPGRADPGPFDFDAFDLEAFDLEAFGRDLDALRERAMASLGPDDAAHLAKVERWGRLCSALGYATAWMGPNPVAILGISTGRLTRWAMVAHHVSHRGYDRVPDAPRARTSRVFAKGWRRAVDWLDWIEPQAWNTEHNWLHHYRLNEEADPDLVERNLELLRGAPIPRWAKLAVTAVFTATWKLGYYAPNTRYEHANVEARRRKQPPAFDHPAEVLLDPRLWLRSVLPYGAVAFVAIPALFAPLGPLAVASVAINSALAELVTNVHAFVIIVPNHAGRDLYRFDHPHRSRAEFYLRQVLGTANFRTGGELNDFLHGYLNYQIEHHLFPKLPMSKLREIQPEVRRICEAHGVPYVQQSVFTRFRETVAVMIGDADMRRAPRLDPRPRRSTGGAARGAA
jgi:fatty acid desaturase